MKNPDCNVSETGSGNGSPSGLDSSFVRRDWLAAAVAGILALCLYVATLGPTITGEDSGEFVVAAYRLGIPHPPGYPLYCLLAHPFAWLPWGDPAWRVNLMSAVFAAGAVALLTLIVIHITGRRGCAVGAALAFACSRTLWSQAVIAEVYAMTVFWMALALLLLLLWDARRKWRLLYALAFVLGTGLVVHNTFVLLLPPILAYLFFAHFLERHESNERGWQRWRVLVFSSFFFASGLLFYLYLPLRSLADPPLDWGNPETLSHFWRMVRRSQYDFMFTQYPRSCTRFLGQMAVMARFWVWEFQPWGACLGAAGLLLLMRRRMRLGLLLTSSAVLVVSGFVFWQNFEFTREWFWVMRVFGIPAYFITAIGLGVVLSELMRRYGNAISVFIMLACIVPSLWMHWRANDKSEYYWARDYSMNLLNTLAPDAIYISESDHASFGLLYLQAVHGMRPDVANIRKYGYLESPLFEEMPPSLREKIGPFPLRRYDPEIIAWLLDNTDRPVYLAKPLFFPERPEWRIVPAGLTFRVLRPHEAAPDRDYWQEYRWHTLDPEDTRGDYTADAMLSEMEMTQARAALLLAEDRTETEKEHLRRQALKHMAQAIRYYGRDPVIFNNAGVLCARYGLYDAARQYFESALLLLPHMSEPRNNLERLTRQAPTPSS